MPIRLRTKIGITIGPASSAPKVLQELFKVGFEYARLNFSHGIYSEHARFIKLIQSLNKKNKANVKIMQDLQGPKIRLGNLPQKGSRVSKGEVIVLNSAILKKNKNEFPVTLKNLEMYVKIKDRILIDDGIIEFKISKIEGTRMYCEVLNDGILRSHKGINLPDSELENLPALSEKDKQDVYFALKHGVDTIALSFVKHAEDIVDLKKLILEYQKKLNKKFKVHIIAKIERPEGVKNIKDILQVADSIMVARGDLALEMPGNQLPITQKDIILEAKRKEKKVMVATQLLASMEENIRPTRAELTDIANAVIDGADSLLLTNETAVGKYPVLALKQLKEIIRTTEQSRYDNKNDK